MRPESPTRVECILTLEMRETTWAVRAAQYRRNIVATPNFQLKKMCDAYGAKIGRTHDKIKDIALLKFRSL